MNPSIPFIHQSSCQPINKRMDEWGGWVYRWVDERVDGLMDGWMD